MTVPSLWFNEVGGFTTYLLIILAAMYTVTYGMFIHRLYKTWRDRN